MGPEIPVRVAPAREAAEVARLIAGFRDYHGDSEPGDDAILATVGALIADPSTEYLLAGEPARGVAQVRYRLSVWTGVEDAWLEDLFVDPDTRGEGFGRALAEACVERARERGCARIQLDSNERNAAAAGLYASLGFESGSPKRWDGGRDLYLTRWL